MLGMIERPRAMKRVRDLFRVHPAVAVEGPHQCGKTTLAHAIADGETGAHDFDLESMVDQQKLVSMSCL